MRPAIYFLVWLVSTLFESGHDWHIHKKLYGQGASAIDRDTMKGWDAAEKGVFLLGISAIEFTLTGDWVYVALLTAWQVWLRWLGHEFWYGLFSGSPFGQFGTTSFLDRALNALELGRWGNAILMTLPAIILSVILTMY